MQEQAGDDGLFYTFCGARCYLAPEMISGLHYDGAKLDIWACGVILYELLSGALPFGDGTDTDSLLNNMCDRKYSCPERFSIEVRELLFRLLDPNPHSRISIAEIMEVPWFKTGFNNNKSSWWPLFKQQYSNNSCNEDCGNIPPCLNAFTLIASWPSGLDLSPLFGGARGVLRFMSKKPVSSIIFKFEKIAMANGFSFREQAQCRMVNMYGKNIGVEVEIFEAVPSVYAVDVRKTDGDTAQYEHFRDQLMIPALQEIVWAWPQNSRHNKNKNKKTESTDQPFKAFLVGFGGALLFTAIRAALKRK